jgi:diaminopimelate epimerase
MQLPFSKMHGLGNDFVVIDATRPPAARLFRAPPKALLRALADRRYGIGCDQVLVIDPPADDGSDFGYRIFNADGSASGQCANGARCVARYIREHGLSRRRRLRVRTATTAMTLELLSDGRVRADLGAPRFEPREIPLAVPARAARYRLRLADGKTLVCGAVGFGNPHAVIEVGDLECAPVERLGRALQDHPAFPHKVNVGFVQFVSSARAKLRVYERGTGETLACGSGACAAMAVGRLWRRLGPRATLQLRGGELQLEWAGEGESLWMTGPAQTVFEGRFKWPN